MLWFLFFSLLESLMRWKYNICNTKKVLLITLSTLQSYSQKFDSYTAHKSFLLLWKLKIHYYVQKVHHLITISVKSSLFSNSIFKTPWIYTSHLSLGLPSNLFISSFPNKILYALLVCFSYMWYMLCWYYLFQLVTPIITG